MADEGMKDLGYPCMIFVAVVKNLSDFISSECTEVKILKTI